MAKEGVVGTVKLLNVKNGYRFVNRNDTCDDIFLQQTAISKSNPQKSKRSL